MPDERRFECIKGCNWPSTVEPVRTLYNVHSCVNFILVHPRMIWFVKGSNKGLVSSKCYMLSVSKRLLLCSGCHDSSMLLSYFSSRGKFRPVKEKNGKSASCLTYLQGKGQFRWQIGLTDWLSGVNCNLC